MAACVLALSACVAQVAEPTPTFQAEMTATPEPSPTIDWFPATATPTRAATAVSSVPTQILEVPVSWDVMTEDDFSDQTHWQTANGAAGTIAYEDEALSLALTAGKRALVSLSDHTLPGSFYLEVTAQAMMCSEADRLGLILWRNSSSGTFRLWFNCRGEVMADRQLSESIGRLLDWQTARKFQPGAPSSNRIAVWAEEGQLRVFVNGVEQYTLQTHRGLSGALGVIAQGAGDNAATFAISDLVIYAP